MQLYNKIIMDFDTLEYNNKNVINKGDGCNHEFKIVNK